MYLKRLYIWLLFKLFIYVPTISKFSGRNECLVQHLSLYSPGKYKKMTKGKRKTTTKKIKTLWEINLKKHKKINLQIPK